MKTRFLKHLTPRVALVIPWFVLGTLLCWPALELGLLLHGTRPGITSTAWALDWLTDCQKNSACLPSQTTATVGVIKAASVQSYQASRQMQLTAVEGLAFLKDVHRDTHSVLSELQTSIHETGLLVRDTRQRLNTALDDADLAVVIFESACGIHCREKERGEVAHVLDLFAEGIEERLEAIECDSH